MIQAFVLGQLDLQLLTMHPVDLESLAGLMILSEKKLPLRSVAPLPGSNAALERASLSVRELPTLLLQELFKDRLRLKLWFTKKHLFDSRPDLGKGIWMCTPASLSALFVRSRRSVDIFTRCLGIDSRLDRATTNMVFQFELLH
jgi:hypothetical protein